MTNETRQFILDTLLPYKENPNNCAMEENKCLYLDSQGRKCAVGKHLVEGVHQSYTGSLSGLLKHYGENIFTEEAKSHHIPKELWSAMQDYHDSIALELEPRYKAYAIERIESLSKFEFPEL